MAKAKELGNRFPEFLINVREMNGSTTSHFAVSTEEEQAIIQQIEEKTQKPAMDVFATAISNIMPEVELKVRRIGAANYQVPVEVSPERKQTLGLRWLVTYSRLRGEKKMEDKLAAEIIDAANGTGASVKRREDVHKMAEAYKAYAHYRW